MHGAQLSYRRHHVVRLIMQCGTYIMQTSPSQTPALEMHNSTINKIIKNTRSIQPLDRWAEISVSESYGC